MSNEMPTWKSKFIIHNADEMTPRQLADKLDISISSIYSFFRRRGIKYKRQNGSWEDREDQQQAKQLIRLPQEEKRIRQRPPAVYTNHSPFGIAS